MENKALNILTKKVTKRFDLMSQKYQIHTENSPEKVAKELLDIYNGWNGKYVEYSFYN